MTTATASTVLADTANRHIVNITGTQSDTTGETDVVKVNISALTMAGAAAGSSDIVPSDLAVEKVEWSIQGFAEIILEFDATADQVIVVLPPGDGVRDFSRAGGIIDATTTGKTGDIVLTSTGAAATGAYDITLWLRKRA